MAEGENLTGYKRRISKQVLLPAGVTAFLFAAFFNFHDLKLRLRNAEVAENDKDTTKKRPKFRNLKIDELTPIPGKSEKVATPFSVGLEKQIQASPSDPEPLLQRAYLQAIWGNEAACREDFQKGLNLSTDKPAVYWSLGWALLNLGRFQEAEQAWSKAWTPREGEPEPGWVPSAMAMACWKSGNKNQGLAWYQRAAEREPESFTTLEGLKNRTANWNTREQNWLIEVYDAWNRTYEGRNSGEKLRKRLTDEATNSSCSTCR